MVYKRYVFFPRVSAAHVAQYTARAALERQVEITADVFVCGYNVEYVICHVVRVGRAEAYSHVWESLGYGIQKAGKAQCRRFCLFRCFVEVFFAPPPYHRYESMFWPSRVTSRYPSFSKAAISESIVCGSRLRSRPRVYGTTQYVHILSQPRMTDTNAVTPLPDKRTGDISPYVSSRDSMTLTAAALSHAWRTSRGRLR